MTRRRFAARTIAGAVALVLVEAGGWSKAATAATPRIVAKPSPAPSR